MEIFEQYRTVTSNDLDELMRVNNVIYLQWIQEIAKAHWESITTKEQQNKNIWVVLSHHIEYKSAAVLDDPIYLKTFVTKSEGVTSTRIVEMYHEKSNQLIVKSQTNWCLLDRETKKPKRISPEIAQVFNS